METMANRDEKRGQPCCRCRQAHPGTQIIIDSPSTVTSTSNLPLDISKEQNDGHAFVCCLRRPRPLRVGVPAPHGPHRRPRYAMNTIEYWLRLTRCRMSSFRGILAPPSACLAPTPIPAHLRASPLFCTPHISPIARSLYNMIPYIL